MAEKEKTELSVIVPIYNVEKYLRQCIESILGQTMHEIELILVDDGSTDGSGAICDEYAQRDNRVQVIHQENRGLLEARYRGLCACTCKYITFVDGDDFVDRVSFALARQAMKSDVDIVNFGYTAYYSETNQKTEYCDFPEGLYRGLEIKEIIWPKLIWNCETNRHGIAPSLCYSVIKKPLLLPAYQKLVETNGMHGKDAAAFPPIIYGEDAAVFFPILKAAESVEIKAQAYYFYRQRENGIIPFYIADVDFFDKIYILYRHLKTIFAGEDIFIGQLERFYIRMVKRREYALYKDSSVSVDHIFPFDRIEKGERIIIYGAGVVGHSYVNQLKQLNYCTVALWVDQNYRKYSAGKVCPIETIQTIGYDKVVIAVANQDLKAEIESKLLSLGVDPEKIVK